MAINKLHNYNVASIGGKTAPQITTNKLHDYNVASIGNQTAPQVTTNKLHNYSTDAKILPNETTKVSPTVDTSLAGPRKSLVPDDYGVPTTTISQAEPGTELPETSIKDRIMQSEKDREKVAIYDNQEEAKVGIKQFMKDSPLTPSLYNPDYDPILSQKIKQVLNSPEVTPVIQELSKRTSGTGIASMVQAIGPKTFTEAYEANRAAQAGDPSKMNQFLTQLGDSAPQTLIGVALNYVPILGRPLSTAYWTALSAAEQIENKGSVTSTSNIGIDVALDSVLGKTIDGLLKVPAKNLAVSLGKTFVSEGGTEVSQDILKMANDYRVAKTTAEKEGIKNDLKEYFTSGQALMTFGVGGLSGAGTNAVITAAHNAKSGEVPLNQKGFTQIPLFGKEITEDTTTPETKTINKVDGVYPAESVIGELKEGDKVKVNDKIYTYKKTTDVTGDIQEILDTGSMIEDDLTINRSKGKVSIETTYQDDEPLYVFDSNTEAKTTETKTEIESRTEKENQIIQQLGEPTQGEPNCVREFRKILKEYPNAKPKRGMYGDTLDDVLFIYNNNKKSNLFSKLGGFTHIRADVNGKIMEGDFDNQPIFGKFYTEEEILKALEQSTSKPLFTGSQPETKTVSKEKILPDGMVIPAKESAKSIFNTKQESEMSDRELQALIASAPKEGDVPLNGVEQQAVKGVTEMIKEDVAISVKEKVGMLDYFKTPWRVFDRLGIRPAFESVVKGYENYNQELRENTVRIRNWSKQLSKESQVRVFEYLDGETIELNEQELKIATEIKTWFNTWANRLGIKPKDRISNYITHIFDAKTGEDIPSEIKNLMKSKPSTSVFNPYLLERLNKEGYKKDLFGAVEAYSKRATRKVNMDPVLQEMNEASAKLRDRTSIDYLNKFLNQINLKPSKMDIALDVEIKKIFGDTFGARPTSTITRFTRRMIARAKIGLSMTSFAKNLTQGVNTFGELGAQYTIEGYRDLLAFRGSSELEDNGVLLSPLLDDTPHNAIKTIAEKADNILFLNMTGSELINRGAAYYGAKRKYLDGKITGKEYQEAFGRRSTSEKGIDTYEPTMEEAIQYGKFVAGKTQFLFGALHTPVGLSSDLAKTAFQFQTFGIKQTELGIGWAKNKDWDKLIRYLASSSLVFGIIGKLFGMAWDESWKTINRIKSPMFSLVESLYQTLITKEDSYGNYLSDKKVLEELGDLILTNMIPGGSQIKKTVQGISTVEGEKLLSPSGKYQATVEKSFWNYLRGALFGKYNLTESQDFYDERDAKAKASAKAKGSIKSIFSGSKKYEGHTY